MKLKEKEKMCPFCEGSVAWEATECKFCGSSLVKATRKAAAYQTQDSLASLYDPPYAPNKKSNAYGIPPTESVTANYSQQPEEETPAAPPKQKPAKETKEKEDDESASLGSLLLLSLGGVLFTLSWLLFFFSDHGRVILEWKSRFWYIYLLLSLPLIYKGYKKLK